MSDQGWWVITISIFDTPNFTGEDVPDQLRPSLPGPLYLEDAVTRWGTESPLYKSKVRGQFPDDAADGTIPWSWLAKCQTAEVTERLGDLMVPVELGVDVGGSDEGDETVIQCRRGPVFAPNPRRVRSSDSEVIVDTIIDVIRETHATSVKVDSIGVGFGVVGSLKRLVLAEVRWDVEIHGVNVAVAPTPPLSDEDPKFVSLRAEIWWQVGREYSRLGLWDLSLLDDDTLAELAAPKLQGGERQDPDRIEGRHPQAARPVTRQR